MGPYESAINNVLNLVAPQPLPQLNGCLLHLPQGAVFLVINGYAKLFQRWESLVSVCKEYPWGSGPPEPIPDGVLDHVFGNQRGGWMTPGRPPELPSTYDIKRFFTNVPHVNFIARSLDFTLNARTVYYPGGPLGIKDYEGSTPVIWGVPSQRVKFIYRLCGLGEGAQEISQGEWSDAVQRGGIRILEEPVV